MLTFLSGIINSNARYIICAGVIFFTGYYLAGLHYKKAFADYQLQIEKQNAENEKQIKIKEQENISNFLLADSEKQAETVYIFQRSADYYEDLESIPFKFDRVYSDNHDNGLPNSDTAASDIQMPGDTTTPGGLSARADQCARSDAVSAKEIQKRLRRLEKDLLTIARDCDITAAHYNSLLKIYNGLK